MNVNIKDIVSLASDVLASKGNAKTARDAGVSHTDNFAKAAFAAIVDGADVEAMKVAIGKGAPQKSEGAERYNAVKGRISEGETLAVFLRAGGIIRPPQGKVWEGFPRGLSLDGVSLFCVQDNVKFSAVVAAHKEVSTAAARAVSARQDHENKCLAALIRNNPADYAGEDFLSLRAILNTDGKLSRALHDGEKLLEKEAKEAEKRQKANERKQRESVAFQAIRDGDIEFLRELLEAVTNAINTSELYDREELQANG